MEVSREACGVRSCRKVYGVRCGIVKRARGLPGDEDGAGEAVPDGAGAVGRILPCGLDDVLAHLLPPVGGADEFDGLAEAVGREEAQRRAAEAEDAQPPRVAGMRGEERREARQVGAAPDGCFRPRSICTASLPTSSAGNRSS